MTNTVEDIRDIKGFVPVPHGWLWLALLGSALLILLLFWWFKRRKPVVAIPVIPPFSPLEIALAALQKLKAANLPVEKFYTQLSDIVRQFIEGRYGLRAPERTTEEFLAEARLPEQYMVLLQTFLQEADLVKFARHRPGADDMARALSAAEKFVRESAV